MLNTPGVVGSSAPFVYWALYGFFLDRFGIEMGIEPGEDNLDYRKFNYHADAGYFLSNTDAGWWRIGVQFKAGDDMVPGVSTLNASNDGVRTLVPADAVKGISGTRASGTPLSSLNLGDANRSLFSVAGGFLDHGPNSLAVSISQSVENEHYTDASSSRLRAIGGELRYYYNRTYSVTLDWNNYEKWDFTDQNGVLHNIPSDPIWSFQLTWRLAMNFAWFVTYGNTQTYVLDQKWQDGKTWGLFMQYLW
jgi:hypothetical protein